MIRGARHIIFYSLPEYPHFYSEIVNLINMSDGSSSGKDDSSSSSISCLTLVDSSDRMVLERVVGKARCDHMLTSAKSTFMFC